MVAHFNIQLNRNLGYIPKSGIAGSWGRLFPTSLRNHHADIPRGWTSLHSHQQCRSTNKLSSAVQDWLYVDLPFTPSPWAPERGWGLLQGIFCPRLPWEPTLSLPPVPGYISGIGGGPSGYPGCDRHEHVRNRKERGMVSTLSLNAGRPACSDWKNQNWRDGISGLSRNHMVEI